MSAVQPAERRHPFTRNIFPDILILKDGITNVSTLCEQKANTSGHF